MRILHTADWHVGKPLRGRSRLEEYQAVLAELVGLADAAAVDLVLVAGDLFDTSSPPPEAERLVYEALLRLAGTRRHVVVLAGNHDSPRRLQAIAPLADLARVHIRPFVVAPNQGGVVELQLGDQREQARIVTLPWLSQRYVISADALLNRDADQHQTAYQGRVRAVVQALCTAGFVDGAVNVVAGHLHALGGQTGGGERGAHTVLDYAVPATAFPASAAYVGLGHLHRCQRIDGPAPTWYPGSPLALDFGEQEDRKSALVIEARAGRAAVVEQVPLTAGRRLRTLEGSLSELLAQRGRTGDAWLRIVVHERARAGLAEDVRELFPDAVDVRIGLPDQDGSPADPAAGARRLGRSPIELFGDYLTERKVDDPRVAALFGQLLEEALTEPSGEPGEAGGAGEGVVAGDGDGVDAA